MLHTQFFENIYQSLQSLIQTTEFFCSFQCTKLKICYKWRQWFSILRHFSLLRYKRKTLLIDVNLDVIFTKIIFLISFHSSYKIPIWREVFDLDDAVKQKVVMCDNTNNNNNNNNNTIQCILINLSQGSYFGLVV